MIQKEKVKKKGHKRSVLKYRKTVITKMERAEKVSEKKEKRKR